MRETWGCGSSFSLCRLLIKDRDQCKGDGTRLLKASTTTT